MRALQSVTICTAREFQEGEVSKRKTQCFVNCWSKLASNPRPLVCPGFAILNRGRVQAFAVECGHLGHGGVNHETNITLAAVGARGVLQYDLACYLALSKTEGGKIAPCMQITFTLREVSKERGLDLTRGRELES
jgi:hypothetical protein